MATLHLHCGCDHKFQITSLCSVLEKIIVVSLKQQNLPFLLVEIAEIKVQCVVVGIETT